MRVSGGSDGAIVAFHNVKQAAFHPPLPSLVATRLFADFLLEARRDVGRADTRVIRAQIMRVRITDLYEVEDYRSALDLPFEELCRPEGWTAPWLAARSGVVERPKTVERIQSAVNSPEGGS